MTATLEELIAAMDEADDLKELEALRTRASKAARRLWLESYRRNRTRIRVEEGREAPEVVIEVHDDGGKDP